MLSDSQVDWITYRRLIIDYSKALKREKINILRTFLITTVRLEM